MQSLAAVKGCPERTEDPVSTTQYSIAMNRFYGAGLLPFHRFTKDNA